MTGDVQPQDDASGLVEREWVRRVGRRRGELTVRPMIGREVEATYLDPRGGLHHAAGTVRRDGTGELVVTSSDGSETPVPRDASVDTIRER